VDTLLDFLSAAVFSLQFDEKRKLAELVLAFDSELAPIVGQQLTWRLGGGAAAEGRLALLVQQGRRQAPRRACDLVAIGVLSGQPRGFSMRADGTLESDRKNEALRSLTEVLALLDTPEDTLTFTCAPPGTGRRLALDRDRDGRLDGDERAAGTDPGDPSSH
jgi:hypothetical protein